MDQHNTEYGHTDHYVNEEGRDYFAIQSRAVSIARASARLFEEYIGYNDTVLDFGCGGGYILSVLNAQTKIGVEINPSARESAAKIGIPTVSTLSELKGMQFSRIITNHALEHVPSPYHALLQLHELLKPGGLLIWNGPLEDWRSKHNRTWRPVDQNMHLYAWNPLLVGNLLTVTGFKPKLVKILHQAFSSRIESLYPKAPFLARTASYAMGILLKRRQLLAVASKD